MEKNLLLANTIYIRTERKQIDTFEVTIGRNINTFLLLFYTALLTPLHFNNNKRWTVIAIEFNFKPVSSSKQSAGLEFVDLSLLRTYVNLAMLNDMIQNLTKHHTFLNK